MLRNPKAKLRLTTMISNVIMHAGIATAITAIQSFALYNRMRHRQCCQMICAPCECDQGFLCCLWCLYRIGLQRLGLAVCS